MSNFVASGSLLCTVQRMHGLKIEQLLKNVLFNAPKPVSSQPCPSPRGPG